MRSSQVNIRDVMKVANERARLDYAFEQVLEALGVPDEQAQKVIRGVKAADFTHLEKLIRK